MQENIDWKTVSSFGEEWQRFDTFDPAEIDAIGRQYFDVLPANALTQQTKALDVGCGSGRWSLFLADKVQFIDAVDPSEAVHVAKKMLAHKSNVKVHSASIDTLPFALAGSTMVSFAALQSQPLGMVQSPKRVLPSAGM